ncbi:unnamed protein product [Ostreobium quekettii]|uniref:Uncharacterized protein n=1 Tax=Ostreobium quekettii TaxID=121088 RepID=A0A8S1JE86_9CHLO|nr:unnamed protein product [Ostreobium quekettii]
MDGDPALAGQLWWPFSSDFVAEQLSVVRAIVLLATTRWLIHSAGMGNVLFSTSSQGVSCAYLGCPRVYYMQAPTQGALHQTMSVCEHLVNDCGKCMLRLCTGLCFHLWHCAE